MPIPAMTTDPDRSIEAHLRQHIEAGSEVTVEINPHNAEGSYPLVLVSDRKHVILLTGYSELKDYLELIDSLAYDDPEQWTGGPEPAGDSALRD